MRAAYTRLYVHLVWATWDRRELIGPGLEASIYTCMKMECRKNGADLVEIGGMRDHVHLLVRIPATVSVADLVKRLKGSSSHLATHGSSPVEFFKWQGGYGALSISAGDRPRVHRYIQNQKEHHAAGTLSRTLERTSE